MHKIISFFFPHRSVLSILLELNFVWKRPKIIINELNYYFNYIRIYTNWSQLFFLEIVVTLTLRDLSFPNWDRNLIGVIIINQLCRVS